MLSNNKTICDDTPKRRRLGAGRVVRSSLQVLEKNVVNCSPINHHIASVAAISEKCESPPLPCNQIEYLHDSGHNDSNSNEIPCSPSVLECSILRDVENWDSLFVSNKTYREKNTNKSGNVPTQRNKYINQKSQEVNLLSGDILRKGPYRPRNHVDNTILTTQCQQYFRDNVKETFEGLNQSYRGLERAVDEKIDNLFESKDSFLLDIKESSIIKERNITLKEFSKPVTTVGDKSTENVAFYGLPLITKGLFKTYRNIEKFYDWQEECLNLDSVKERRNLIYALPTSGGKTLVAEVLMLREVLNRKHNVLFILPFVAIVQEKIWSLSPFALQLDFLVEEYAAGKGHIPPKKRRKKNSIYVATIEKGLALVRSLIELNRLHEIGLIVVDELHLIGEPGRGGTLETLLSTVIFANQGIQIVGMSATIGNLHEIAQFLRAEVFQREFRPVELTEYVKLGDTLHRIVWGPDGMDLVPERKLEYDYSAAAASLDPDRLGGLVAEVVPRGSCLVFCPTKRNCENVAALLCKLQRSEMVSHRREERLSLEGALRSEGAAEVVARAAGRGVGLHHAGLAADERALLEGAFSTRQSLRCNAANACSVNSCEQPSFGTPSRSLFFPEKYNLGVFKSRVNRFPSRSGVISVLCCTSTLAAGVNLPARRVIIRAPTLGRAHLSLSAYRQMVGRAGRAGVCDAGESIIICSEQEWPRLRSVLRGGLPPARSVLAGDGDGAWAWAGAVRGLVLSAVWLRLAAGRAALRELLAHTLLALHTDTEKLNELCDQSLRSLLQSGALELAAGRPPQPPATCYVYNDTEFAVSAFGKAAIKGCMDLNVAKQLLHDLEAASKALVLMGSLHLLYLVTPHDAAGIRPDYRHYYSLYCNLDDEGMQTARILGITEVNAVRMMTGKPITNVPEKVLCRFYLALMLHDLWKQMPLADVAEKYCLPRGTVQSVMSSSAAFASNAHRFCEELQQQQQQQQQHVWPFAALLGELAPRLRHCASPELHQLMELPAVKKARALQLWRAGYKRIEDVARATADDLVASIQHLSRSAANHLVSAAKMMLIEKVENLRAEAEDVMEELNM